jgi:ribosomal protein S16
LRKYSHYVIRIRKGKRSNSQVYQIVVILNQKKTKSQKIIERLGFFKYGKERLLAIDTQSLAKYLNKGYILKGSVRKLIYKNTLI